MQDFQYPPRERTHAARGWGVGSWAGLGFGFWGVLRLTALDLISSSVVGLTWVVIWRRGLGVYLLLVSPRGYPRRL